MIKLIALLKAKAGLSRSEFIDHYEHHHAPLIRSIAPQITAYDRNYLLPAMRGSGAQLTWDVITELRFDNQAAFDDAMQALAARRDDIRADEERFLDIDAIQLYRVDTDSAAPDFLNPEAAG